jgi:hypothetical protein
MLFLMCSQADGTLIGSGLGVHSTYRLRGIRSVVSILLFEIKTGYNVVCLQADGTLIGSALGVCFTYWLGASGLLWVMSYVFSVHLTIVQTLSMIVSTL